MQNQNLKLKILREHFIERGYDVLLIAIFLSFIWHVAWLSVITIAAPRPAGPVRFSKVSFLGPILARGAMELKVRPKERSFLEKRYLDKAGRTSLAAGMAEGLSYAGYEPKKNFDILTSGAFASLVDEAVAGQKLEPGYSAQINE